MSNRNWLITGVATGFGRLMAGRLLAQGARVAGTVHSKDALADLQHAYGNRLWLTCLDHSHMETICDGVDEAFWELGTIDVVVDLIGSRDLQRAVLLHLRRQGSGCILHLSGTEQDGHNAARSAQTSQQIALPALAYGVPEWISAR